MLKLQSFTEEVWKDMAGFEGYYQISSFAKIKNVKTGKVIKPHLSNTGYYLVWLHRDTIRFHYSLHRLVAWHFLPPGLSGQEVHHKNDNKSLNVASNLEWVYHDKNMRYAADSGSMRKGFEHHVSKAIIHTDSGKVYGSISEAAKAVGCSMVNISMQLRGMRKNKLGFAYYNN